jgi:hypothetical protein
VNRQPTEWKKYLQPIHPTISRTYKERKNSTAEILKIKNKIQLKMGK